MEPEGSLLCSQELTIGSYSRPVESSSLSHHISLRSILNPAIHIYVFQVFSYIHLIIILLHPL
jgi:hypothetical protein